MRFTLLLILVLGVTILQVRLPPPASPRTRSIACSASHAPLPQAALKACVRGARAASDALPQLTRSLTGLARGSAPFTASGRRSAASRRLSALPSRHGTAAASLTAAGAGGNAAAIREIELQKQALREIQRQRRAVVEATEQRVDFLECVLPP